jgi:hypothetical protein
VNNKGSIRELTIGEVLAGLRRYQPFIAAVAAVVLIVAILPGKPKPASSESLATVNTPTGTANQQATGSPGAIAGAPGAVNPGGVAAPQPGASGAGAGAGGVTGSVPGGANLSNPTVPTSTTDPFCDKATGRDMIPSLYAPSCVPPFSGSNGGATYNGVTAKTITVAVPMSNNQAQAKALAAAANDNDTTQQVQDTLQNYLNLFVHHMQTYGRTIQVKYFTSAYNSTDSTSAQNAECQSDATTIAKSLHAFITVDIFAQECGTLAYQNTLARDGVLCWCTVTVPASYYLNWAPYVWGTGLPDETSAYLMRAEVICKEVAPYPPQYAGEADLNDPIAKKRVFGLIWPGASSLDNTDAYVAGANFFKQQLAKCGVSLAEDDSFPIVDTNGPADAQTLMAKFKQKGVTTVILVSDPIDPIYLTNAASKQQYFPEWFNTGSALIDETHYGRLYDSSEWKHSFGVSFLPDRVPTDAGEAWAMYSWGYHTTPPAPYTTNNGLYAFARSFVTGVQLAGPKLTPYTFQCGQPPYTMNTHSGPLGSSHPVACVGKTYPGMFGFPISPTHYTSRISNPVISWGSKLWPWDDYNMLDDGTLIWWDPSSSGVDETGSNGNGMMRYMYGGKRYMYGQYPKGKQPWFSTADTVTVFSSVPKADRAPTYPYRCYYMC